jgi:hypothetical protein
MLKEYTGGKIKLIHDGKVYEQFAHLQSKSPEMRPFKITNSVFKKRSKELFGDIFDYSLIDCNVKSKIKLIYNGKVYEQSMFDHLNGHLPKEIAPKSKGEITIEKYEATFCVC